MDVNYRGFTASPLLGTPQGLSVYQDGVRINEPFGDVVNWDLIPRRRSPAMTLLPGSNPLFGLNTLGGALSLQTKSGDTHPGTELELPAGSFGRRQHRAHARPHSSANTDICSWRSAASTKTAGATTRRRGVRQLFAKVGRATAAGSRGT